MPSSRTTSWARRPSACTLPQPAHSPVCDILVASDEAYDLRGRTEPIPQDSVEDIEVAIGDLSGACRLGSDEFGEFLRGHRNPPPPSCRQPECIDWSGSVADPSGSPSELVPPVKTERLFPRRPPRSAFPSVRGGSAWRSNSASAADVSPSRPIKSAGVEK